MIHSSQQIWDTAFGYRTASVLFAAMDLKIFEFLNDQPEGAGIQTIASNAKAVETKLAPLLNVLCQMGLLTKTGNAYQLTSASKAAVSDSTLTGVGRFRSEVSEWANLAQTLRSPGDRFKEDQIFTTDEVFPYLDMVRDSNLARVDVVADAILSAGPTPTNILDIGGGHGLYSERLLERCPDATATLQDLPAALSYADQHIGAQSRLRLRLVEGDARKHQEPADYSIVMVNDLLHSFGHAEKVEILRRATAALKPGGVLFVGKFNMDDDTPSSEQSNHMFSLKMALNSRDGYLESNTEVVNILTELGLANVTQIDIPNDIPSVLVHGQKA
ncbi:MAG: class I SAM-dependent methyltransferase [Paracoccaceae bacterium]